MLSGIIDERDTKQEAQLSGDHVIEYFAKSLKVIRNDTLDGKRHDAEMWVTHHVGKNTFSRWMASLNMGRVWSGSLGATSLSLLSLPSISLEVGPLNPARGSGGAL